MMETYTYWKLTPVQEIAVSKYLKGSDVYDLSCGNLKLTRWLARFAKSVHAIDKDADKPRVKLPKNVKLYRRFFDEVKPPDLLDCVVVSWPPNYFCSGLVDLVRRACRVVYIGCNTGGAACGTPELFVHLSKRYMVHELRDRRNCVHCYSAVCHADAQFRSEEEVCGMLSGGKFRMIPYDDLLSDVTKK